MSTHVADEPSTAAAGRACASLLGQADPRAEQSRAEERRARVTGEGAGLTRPVLLWRPGPRGEGPGSVLTACPSSGALPSHGPHQAPSEATTPSSPMASGASEFRSAASIHHSLVPTEQLPTSQAKRDSGPACPGVLLRVSCPRGPALYPSHTPWSVPSPRTQQLRLHPRGILEEPSPSAAPLSQRLPGCPHLPPCAEGPSWHMLPAPWEHWLQL